MLKHSPFSGPKSITSAAPVVPPPKDSDTYPVLASIGIDYWPDVEAFEDLEPAVQFAWMAQRGTASIGAISEQQQDFIVIANADPTKTNNLYGDWHGVSVSNNAFINHYYNSVTGYSQAQINASWQAYLNWILGIDDGNSYGAWDGTEAGIQSWKYWAVHSRKFSFSVVPHNGW